ncbi:hypothetical protein LBMAG42_52830 [Deltaproteobacteria bacterium]|nr:hypothetical protein LBMAG42_52830 [Deltaproteobacteria bacterium]
MFLLAGFMACEAQSAAAGGARQLADYAGVAGTRIELAPAEMPDEPPLLLTIGADSWEARLGEDWDTAAPIAVWTVVLGERLVVADVTLLSMPLPDAGELVTWYGTFPEAVNSTVDGAPFGGEWSFAPDLGPVVITLDGVRRECVVYEREVDVDTGG